MAIIKVPESVATSPQGSGPLKFDTEANRFTDEHENVWTIDDLAGSRPGNRIRKWHRDNYPQVK